MKREFNMSFKQDIIKGKVKVVTDCGEPAEIVKWNCKGNYPILAVIDDGDTSDSCFYDEEGLSSSKKERIYVLTDEPELTEFEEEILMTIQDYELNKKDGFTDIDSTKKHAKRILNAANKIIQEDMPKWKVATENLSIGCLVWNKSRNFHLYSDEVYEGELYISIADILRLPGSPKEK